MKHKHNWQIYHCDSDKGRWDIEWTVIVFWACECGAFKKTEKREKL